MTAAPFFSLSLWERAGVRAASRINLTMPTDPSESSSSPKPLSAHDAAELAGTIGDLSASGLPLAPGLRATAAELPAGRLQTALERIAANLDRGQSLEQALTAEGSSLPGYMRALIAAGVRTGRLGATLQEFLHFRQTIDDLRRSVWRAIAYPAFLLGMVGVLYWLFFAYFMPFVTSQLGFTVNELFSTEPSNDEVAQAAKAFSNHQAAVAVVLLGIIALCGLWAFFAGPLRRRRLLHAIPMFGPLWRFSGVAEFAELLRILIACEVPMPEAIRLTADAMSNAAVGAAGQTLADRAASGKPLAESLTGLPPFPAWMPPILAWGERSNSLGEALAATVDSCTQRLHSQAGWLKRVIPPAACLLVFVLVGRVIAQFFFFMRSFVTPMGFNTALSGEFHPPEQLLYGSVCLIVLATAIFVAMRLVYTRGSNQDAMSIAIRIVSQLLVIGAITAALCIFENVLGLAIAVGALFFWGSVVFAARESKRASLLHLLAAAIERGIPLEPIARAAAAESDGAFSLWASRLADDLGAGVPVLDAFARNRYALPAKSELAARVGSATGDWSNALRVLDRERVNAQFRDVFDETRLFLFFAAFGVSICCYTWMAERILPSFFAIFRDFHARLPALTARVFEFGDVGAAVGFYVWIVLSTLALIYGLRAIGVKFGDVPLLCRITAPLESANVLRWTSLAVEREQSLAHFLELLARKYRGRLIRKRLRRASAEIAAGREWTESLRAHRIIQRKDAMLLAAAERARNLPWALREAASSAERAFFYRAHALMQILFPVCVIMLGIAVAVLAAACLLPLVQLIQGLAR